MESFHLEILSNLKSNPLIISELNFYILLCKLGSQIEIQWVLPVGFELEVYEPTSVDVFYLLIFGNLK